MRSKDKLDVITRRMPDYENKLWLVVRVKDGRPEFVPSFEDFRRMACALWWCEERNYPPGEGFLGGEMFEKLIRDEDFWDPQVDWETLAKRYHVPIRDGRQGDKTG